MDPRPRVALLIESSRAYGRGLLRGIAQYARTHGPWSLFHHERRIGDDAPAWLGRWRGHGVIARIETLKLRNAIVALGLPCVDLRGLHDVDGVPVIDTDERATVRMALDHLAERGFEHYAFCGFEGANYSEARAAHFRRLVRQAGREPIVYQGPTHTRGADTTAIEAEGLLYEDQIAQWLKSLPTPVGVMACNDIRAVQVLNACRDHGIAVPDDVAVIGVDNDELLCELCDPPLSSVEPDTDTLGYRAAAALDRRMRRRRGRDLEGSIAATRVVPRGVVTRQSTDVLAMADRQVAAAVRFIRQHASEGVTVEDVLSQLAISRSTLERRFDALLGRSPKEEIIRVRLERVKRLLRETTYPLPMVARLAGFKHHEYMSAQFRQKVGQTPGQFRRQAPSAAGSR
jgi:LacI family transcriptional regulator